MTLLYVGKFNGGLERRDQYELGSDQVWCGLHQPELASSFLDSDGVVFI